MAGGPQSLSRTDPLAPSRPLSFATRCAPSHSSRKSATGSVSSADTATRIERPECGSGSGVSGGGRSSGGGGGGGGGGSSSKRQDLMQQRKQEQQQHHRRQEQRQQHNHWQQQQHHHRQQQHRLQHRQAPAAAKPAPRWARTRHEQLAKAA